MEIPQLNSVAPNVLELRGFSSHFFGAFKAVSLLAFLCLFFNHSGNPFLSGNPNWNLGDRIGRLVSADVMDNLKVANDSDIDDSNLCFGMLYHRGFSTPCEFLIAYPECSADGFLDYVRFFYCGCEKFPVLGYGVLFVWLVALFYLLGNTAADYFCCSLEKLAQLLHLPPTVAGISLLPLGNGAPDVFASIAAFVGKNAGQVGLNSVLGGAVFVTCVVAGTVSLCAAEKRVQIDKKCFVRDICFFLFALASLAILLIDGQVTLVNAVVFISIYIIYAFTVAISEILKQQEESWRVDNIMQFISFIGSVCVCSNKNEGNDSQHSPLLESYPGSDVQNESKLDRWRWASNVAIYSNEAVCATPRTPRLWEWDWNDVGEMANEQPPDPTPPSKLFLLLDLPLTLPRRLTIPIVEEERWLKGYAVASASLSPILLACLWNTQDDLDIVSQEIAYFVSIALGVTLGVLAYLFTSSDQPPQRCLLPWVVGGFVMSIVWFYIIANELVALLVSLGIIFRIKPAILGLTILAWGNSMGDLMSNVALAANGGDSTQIAMSGCYAGPMFNTLIGLGISMLLGAWSKRPGTYIIPDHASLFFPIGFLAAGLIWSLIVLPKNDMRPNKVLGLGLIMIYLIFLFSRLSLSMGMVPMIDLD